MLHTMYQASESNGSEEEDFLNNFLRIFFQFCSNEGSRVQNSLDPGVPWFKLLEYIKI